MILILTKILKKFTYGVKLCAIIAQNRLISLVATIFLTKIVQITAVELGSLYAEIRRIYVGISSGLPLHTSSAQVLPHKAIIEDILHDDVIKKQLKIEVTIIQNSDYG